MTNQPAPLYDAIKSVMSAPARVSEPEFRVASKAIVGKAKFVGTAIKASTTDEGVIIMKVSVADSYDHEGERALLPALKSATFDLVKRIGTDDAPLVDINHEATPVRGEPPIAEKAIECEILQAWIGDPMPEPNAAYVAFRPPAEVYEAAKKGLIVGASWTGPYTLVESEEAA